MMLTCGHEGVAVAEFDGAGDRMLTRQKILLALLDSVGGPLPATVFVKLCFLLREETVVRDYPTFYGFVPYRFGPFSFALYRELDALGQQSYVAKDGTSVGLGQALADESRRLVATLPAPVRLAVRSTTGRYGGMTPRVLVRDVYARFPWYATRSEMTDLLPVTMPQVPLAAPAVYTVGYERSSVDEFFDRLLRAGIRVIADVRANPVSRKYGFARSSLSRIAGSLDMGYEHFPRLGIPSSERVSLDDSAALQRLLDRYERQMLPAQSLATSELCKLVQKHPTVLLCVEHDIRCCHRARLARAVATRTGLPVAHL
jgi:hypothetical protein